MENEVKPKLKVVVIGHGHLGRWHAEKVNQNELVDLYAIVEPDTSKKAEISKKFSETKIVPTLEDVIDEADAALIVTPTSTHYEIVKKLLEKKVHIFCEKPLCSNLDQALEIGELNSKVSRVFQVGHSERFHNIWKIINKNAYYKKFLEAIGTLRVSRLSPFKGRASDVDVVQDLMVHDIDLLIFLFGEIPSSVSSTGHKIRTGHWDYVCSEFSFKSGRRAILTVGRNHVKEVREMEYTSDLGCMYIDMFQNELLLSSGGEIPPSHKKISPYVEVLSYEKQDHLLVEQSHFFESIINDGNTIVTAEDGILAIRLISKVLESLERKKEVMI